MPFLLLQKVLLLLQKPLLLLHQLLLEQHLWADLQSSGCGSSSSSRNGCRWVSLQDCVERERESGGGGGGGGGGDGRARGRQREVGASRSCQVAPRHLRRHGPVVLPAPGREDLDVPPSEVAPVPGDGREQRRGAASQDDEGLAAGAVGAGDEEDVDALCRGLKKGGGFFFFFFPFQCGTWKEESKVSFEFCEAGDRRGQERAGAKRLGHDCLSESSSLAE